MSRMKWRMRSMARSLRRNYRGMTDIAALIVGIAGAVVFMFGVMLVLCGEWSSVGWMTIGGADIFTADELFRWNRKKS